MLTLLNQPIFVLHSLTDYAFAEQISTGSQKSDSSTHKFMQIPQVFFWRITDHSQTDHQSTSNPDQKINIPQIKLGGFKLKQSKHRSERERERGREPSGCSSLKELLAMACRVVFFNYANTVEFIQ